MAANSGKSVKNVQLNEEAISNKQVAAGELEAYSVYVVNVDYGCTEEELKAHFEKCGRVKGLTIPKNEYGNPRGYAFVEFSDVDSVAKALAELNGSILRSREITVSRAKSNRRNWNNPNTSGRLRLPLEQRPPKNWRSVSANPNRSSSRPSYANTNNRQQHWRSSSNSRFSYVRATGVTTNSATANHENSDKSIQEEAIPIEQGGALIGGGGEEFDRYSVYVDNVDYWCTAQHLLTHFESSGIVNRISIPINEFGNPQGYAFVEFSDLGSADKALQLNGSTLRSRNITVSRKRKLPIRQNPKNKNNSGGGFGGPTQQQPSAISRNVGACSNRSSHPPYPNYTNTNRPLQPQKPHSSTPTTHAPAAHAQRPTASPSS